MPKEEKSFTIVLTENEANTILGALNEIPTKFGMPLIQNIIKQAQAQQQQQAAIAPTPLEVVENV